MPASGIVGQNLANFRDAAARLLAGTLLSPAPLDAASMDYVFRAPEHIADAVVHAIDQPLGVSISEMTIRAAGDHFIL